MLTNFLMAELTKLYITQQECTIDWKLSKKAIVQLKLNLYAISSWIAKQMYELASQWMTSIYFQKFLFSNEFNNSLSHCITKEHMT